MKPPRPTPSSSAGARGPFIVATRTPSCASGAPAAVPSWSQRWDGGVGERACDEREERLVRQSMISSSRGQVHGGAPTPVAFSSV